MSGSTVPRGGGPGKHCLTTSPWHNLGVVAVRNTPGPTEVLARLATALESVDLRGADILDHPVPAARDRLVRTIRSYLIPRVETPDSPFLVVFAGPTGAGKSTLVNSLAGLDVTTAGPVRPTTAVPLALAGSEEVGRIVDGVDCRVVVGGAPILEHMTLVDTPDIDSTSSEHRVIAERLVDQADIVVFVTSALRYADDVPWEVLRRAQSRGATIIPVLNRVGAGSAAVLPDFRELLVTAGIDEDPVRLPEHHLGPGSQRIPSLAVRELRRTLFAVAQDRSALQRQVVNRVINSLFDQVGQLVAEVEEVDRILESAAEEMGKTMAATVRLPPQAGSSASLDLMPPPGGGLRRWRRWRQPRPTALVRWEEAVKAGLTAELETALRQAVATSGAPLIALGHTLSALCWDASAMLGSAVGDWIDEIHRIADRSAQPRLEVMTTIAATLNPLDVEVVAVVLGEGHADRIAAARQALISRVEVVHSHYGERLADAWRLATGQPDSKDLGPRLAAVVAAHQFADA